MPTLTRSRPDRYTTHELRGFLALPLVFFLAQIWLAGSGHRWSIWLLLGACAGWVVMYWALLNQARSDLAFGILIVLIVLASAGIVAVVVSLAGDPIPGINR